MQLRLLIIRLVPGHVKSSQVKSWCTDLEESSLKNKNFVILLHPNADDKAGEVFWSTKAPTLIWKDIIYTLRTFEPVHPLQTGYEITLFSLAATIEKSLSCDNIKYQITCKMKGQRISKFYKSS